MNILADASLPGLVDALPKPFNLTLYYHNNEVSSLLKEQDILLCRSTLKVNQDILTNQAVRVVATASSGSDHLDHAYLTQNNIAILDAKGCNATAVADYMLSTLAYLDKNGLINGKKVGITGLGYVGSTVYHRIHALGFIPFCYDPMKERSNTSFKSCTLEQLYSCDIVCIHAELHQQQPHPSFHLVNDVFLQKLKPGCILINAARGGIIDESALLRSTNQLIYCTDVYSNEPQINKEIINKALLCTPHIAGHSLEAKYNAVIILSKKLHQLFGLPLPQYNLPKNPTLIDQTVPFNWQDLALSLYNPLFETQHLKNAANKELSFLSLRKEHHNRHDFYTYFPESLNQGMIDLLLPAGC